MGKLLPYLKDNRRAYEVDNGPVDFSVSDEYQPESASAEAVKEAARAALRHSVLLVGHLDVDGVHEQQPTSLGSLVEWVRKHWPEYEDALKGDLWDLRDAHGNVIKEGAVSRVWEVIGEQHAIQVRRVGNRSHGKSRWIFDGEQFDLSGLITDLVATSPESPAPPNASVEKQNPSDKPLSTLRPSPAWLVTPIKLEAFIPAPLFVAEMVWPMLFGAAGRKRTNAKGFRQSA